MPAAEWTARIAAVDDDRNPIPPERAADDAGARRAPAGFARRCGSAAPDGEWRHLHVTAFPLIGERDALLGAMSIFWEI